MDKPIKRVETMGAAAMVAAVIVLGLLGCGGEDRGGGAASESPAPMAKTSVWVTFYPGEYLTSRLSGDLVEVTNPLPADADPIFWRPGADVLAGYQGADLIVLNGAGFEKWVETASLPASKVVNMAEVFRDEWVTFENAVTHSHGPAGEHSHEGLDGHTWVDPVNAKIQAGVMRDRLLSIYPDEAGAIQDRYAALSRELDGLDNGLREVTALLAGRPLLASHPAYNYPAKRYGWKMVNLDLNPDAALDDQSLAEIRAAAETSGARTMLWESAPREETVTRLRDDLGVTSVVFSPVESLGEQERAAGEDYITIMRANVQKLKAAVAASGDAGTGVR